VENSPQNIRGYTDILPTYKRQKVTLKAFATDVIATLGAVLQVDGIHR